jgi:peptide/nickel transport system permease protein
MKRTAAILLLVLYLASGLAIWLAPHSYATQYRDETAQPPSSRFPLGTDELGRDRWSRLLTGTRVSLLLAPSAALLAVLLAALAAGLAELRRGWWRTFVLASADLTLSIPTLFLLLLLRAMLPLNTSPAWSLLITFSLLGTLGWAAPARVMATCIRSILEGDYITAARARGIGGWRLWVAHLLPAMRPVLTAQFFTLLPVFLLAEANLGLLGLGVTEPLPSWGGLLRDLEPLAAAGDNLLTRPWLLAPALVMVAAIAAFSVLASQRRPA